MRWMMKNSKGKPDALFTFAFIGFFVTTGCVVASVLKSVTVGNFALAFNVPDVALLSMYFGGTFTAYVMRRNTKDKLDLEELKHGVKKEE